MPHVWRTDDWRKQNLSKGFENEIPLPSKQISWDKSPRTDAFGIPYIVPLSNGAPAMTTASLPTVREVWMSVTKEALSGKLPSKNAEERLLNAIESAVIDVVGMHQWHQEVHPSEVPEIKRRASEFCDEKRIERLLGIIDSQRFSDQFRKQQELEDTLKQETLDKTASGSGLSRIVARAIDILSGSDGPTFNHVKMLEELRAETLMVRLVSEKYKQVRDKEANDFYRIDKVWKVVAMQMLLCYESLISIKSNDHGTLFGGGGYLDALTNTITGKANIPASYVFTNIVTADPFIWHEQVLDLANDMELGEHVLGEELLPTDRMLFVFEKPIRITSPEGKRFIEWMWVWRDEDDADRINFVWNDKGIVTNKIIKRWLNLHGEECSESCMDEQLSDGNYNHRDHMGDWGLEFEEYIFNLTGLRISDEVTTIDVWMKSPVGQKIHSGYFYIGTPYPMADSAFGSQNPNSPDEWNSYAHDITDLTIRLLTFLNHDVTNVHREKLGRAERRGQEREDKKKNIKPKDTLVNVVELRRHRDAPEDPYQRISSKRKGIRHNGAHWVTGHFRQQPYGLGMSLRKQIWIKPHVRGTGEIKNKKRVYVVKK